MTETVPAPRGSAARAGIVGNADRRLGAVFTKAWVVGMVLDLAGYTTDRDLAAVTAYEPACGHGAFVGQMVDRLLASCQAHGRRVEDAPGAIRAYDLDALAVRATRAVAVRALVRGGVDRTVATDLGRSWVNRADFLLPGPPAGSADVVVGNPPYVRLEDVPSERMDAYRATWPTMTGRADLYVGFLEAGLQALRPEGTLAVICADRWMRNQYGRRLRDLVERDFAVDATVVLHSVDAFDRRVAAYPAIALIRRGRQRDALAVEADPSFSASSASIVTEMVARRDRPLPVVPGAQVSWTRGWFRDNGSWPSGSPERLALVADLERRFPPLAAGGGTRVGIGIATGADAVYVTDDARLVEPDRLLPLAMSRDTATGTFAWSGRYLVNPWDANGTLVDLRHYPRLRSYLGRHRATLGARHVARRMPDAWWRTIDRVAPGLLDAPKLLVPDLKRQVHPVLEPGGTYPHHNLFYVTAAGWDLEVLGGLLLSDVATAFVEAYSVRMANDCLRVTAQYLRRVRLPDPVRLRPGVADRLREAFRLRDREAATEAAVAAYGLRSRDGLREQPSRPPPLRQRKPDEH
jgi:adenine-specific DNA-methyltransferase